MSIAFLINVTIIFPTCYNLKDKLLITNYALFFVSVVINFVLAFKDPGFLRLRKESSVVVNERGEYEDQVNKKY